MPCIQTLLDLFFPPRESERLIRHKDVHALVPFLTPIHVQKTTPATAALMPFHQPLVRAAIHEAKFANSRQAQRMLAVVLEEYIAALPNISHVVPIPLSPERMRERGYNQCEEVIRLTQSLPIAPRNILVRIKDTEHQTHLSRADRKQNMRDAFLAAPDPTATYVLIDDVITTGATIQAAISALTAAGARHIIPIALAH